MTILALLTYLPFDSLISIKAVSLIFDFICAIAGAQIAGHIFKDHEKSKKEIIKLVVYSFILFLPTVLINSSYWGQADAIYTAFILLSLLYLLKEKYTRAFIFFGIAFSFKLQSIFILPLYILFYISERKFPFYKFLYIFLTVFVMCIPSMIFGNSLSNCIDVYIGQTNTYSQYVTLNFPNVYSIFFESGSSHLLEVQNEAVGSIGIVFTMFIFVMLAFLVLSKKVKFDNRAIIEFGLWSILISTFFLPQMHERYLFMGDIIAILYFILNKEKYYVPIIIQFISAYGYIYLMFGAFGLEMKFVGILFFIILSLYSKDMCNKYFFKNAEKR